MIDGDRHAPHPIALCITELEVGGAERMFVELASRLDRQRFAPRVYVLGAVPLAGRDELVQRLRAADVPTIFLNATRRWQAPATVARLSACWRRERPALVQSFLFHANLAARMAARAAGVPHVICGLRVAEPTRRWRLRIDWATSGLVERYVAVSEDVAKHAVRDGGLPVDKLTVIANGVDFARFAGATPIDARALGVPAGRRFFAFIGRLEEQKRPAWLLRLLGEVFARLPEHDLVLVGDGPQRAALEQLARDLKLEARVHFTGKRGDVPDILAAADALVLPSAWEGMPNVVLEAMAAGRPVVACDVTGVRELLGSGDEQIVPGEDAAGFALRIAEICGKSSAIRRLGDENRHRAGSFSLARMVAAYEVLWSDALASRARSRELVTRKKNEGKC